MDIKNHRAIKQEAAFALSQASYDPRKLVFIHSGVTLGVTLLLTVLNFVFARQIDMNGGISGLGVRTMLGTIQSVLQFVSRILIPFWQIGFVYTVLRLARKQSVGPRSLLKGFSHIFPVLGLMCLEAIVIAGIGFISMYLSSMAVMMTPFAVPLANAMKPLMEGSILNPAVLDEAAIASVLSSMKPVLILWLVVFGAVMIPILYRFRMARFLLMDAPAPRAFGALIGSCRIMKRNCMDLFRVDLSFWWYYGLQVLIILIGYGDVLLPRLGIGLPFSEDVSFFLFYILYVVLQFALLLWAKAQVDTSYAVVYDQLLTQPPQSGREQKAPGKMPWG